MNPYQEHWSAQARSDLSVLLLLRRNGVDPCHQLHYLQMVTEKLAKGYFWRSGDPPPKNHAAFVQFMRSLGGVPPTRQAQLATIFEFKAFNTMQDWMCAVLPLVYDLERLAPALARDGPNPEYPWPHHAPVDRPAGFPFPLWARLTHSSNGRQLLRVIELAVNRFASYA